MQERLHSLLNHEQLSPSRFADLIGVQRSSVSHILSGRNKPSFDFLEKTLKAFPGLRADWLLLGEGDMFSGQQERDMELFGPDQAEQGKERSPDVSSEPPAEGLSRASSPDSQREVSRVILIYKDGSFSSHDSP
jgi:transcriptional regulator with XRE-family HTH domain